MLLGEGPRQDGVVVGVVQGRGEGAGSAGVEAPTDDELLVRAKEGDMAAATQLLRRYRRMMLGIIVHAHGIRAADAEDVLQDAHRRFASKLPVITYPYGFFVVTAGWAAKGHLRTMRRQRRLMAEVASGMPQPSARSWRRQEEAQVRRLDMRDAFRHLGQKCKSLLRAIVIERTRHRSFAEETGTPIGSVQPTIRRCLDRMRAFLERGSRGGNVPSRS